MYGNEAGVGAAIKDSGLDRDDLYVTTKLNNSFHRPDDARREIDASLERLGLDQVDLFLIHWPLPTRYDGDFVQTWRGADRGAEGREDPHRSASRTSSPPTSTASSRRPAWCRWSTRSRCTRSSPTRTCAPPTQRHGVLTEAWSPIAKGKVVDDDTIGEIASLVGRTPAQVALRWHVQRGDIVFPKSMNRDRMQQNFELFDFELEPTHMSAIDELDRGEAGRTGPEPGRLRLDPP